MTGVGRPRRLRRLAYRGTIECAALVIDRELLGEQEARRRVVASCSEGAVAAGGVIPTPLGYLVRFATPRRMRVGEANGLALVAQRHASGEILSSAPLADDECAALSPPAGAVIVAQGGEAVILDASAAPVDPAQWLDLDEWSLVSVTALAPPPPAAKMAEVAAERSAGTILVPSIVEGGPPLRSVALAKALREEPETGSPYRSKPSVAGAALRAVVVAVAHVLSRARAKRGDDAYGPDDAPSGSESTPGLLDRLQDWLARLALQTRLGRWLGTAHARYLGELFEMFERGDLDAALRHAIPLGGESSGGPASLAKPRPRTELTIGSRATIATTALHAAADVFEELRRRYRAAVERLERDGRIDEAAFVLAELLLAEEEAVAFLERHGRLRKAAELAEGRRLAPGLVVRQWYLAGDSARAVRIARRHGCFEDAIVRLERSRKEAEAATLRMAWAESLAAGGDYAGAVDAAWPRRAGASLVARDAPDRTAVWMDLAIEAGGAGAARMLARKIGLGLGVEEAVLAAASALLAEEGPEGRVLRARFAEALVGAPRSRLGAPIARATTRALFADSEEAERDLEPLVRDLIELSGDAGLKADRPKLTRRTLRLDPYRHVIRTGDRGSRPVHDAVALPRRRMLVALGDLGVALVDSRGRTLTHFDHPAEQLVPSDHGTRAIGVLTRGRASRLSRIDLVGRRSEPWGEIELLDHASTFDGSTWVVVRRSAEMNLVALDATVDGLEITGGTDLGGEDGRILGRSATRLVAIAMWGKFDMLHHYELPSWTLRGRFARSPIEGGIATASPAGDVAQVGACEGELAPTLWLDERSIRIGIRADEVPLQVRASGAFHIVLVRGVAQVRVIILASPSCMPRGEIILEGAARATSRVDEGLVTIADDVGRILVVDLLSGRIERDLRL